MHTDLPSPDYVIAEIVVTEAPYRADASGVTDCTTAFQAAIDSLADRGGGVVFVPAGRYRFDGSLQLRSGVTLRGEWASPGTDGSGGVQGTILAVYGGRGEEGGTPFLTMEKVSCARDLSFWYPEQRPDAVVPYPWTVTVTQPSSCGYALINVTFVNAYNALSNGAETGQGYNVAYYRDLYGTPLNHGVWIEAVLDITRMQRFYFSPRFWENSGLPGAPRSAGEREALRTRLRDRATGVTVRRFDWCPLYDMWFDGYAVGVHLTPRPEPLAGASNGEMHAVRTTDCGAGLRIDDIQAPGWLLSRCSLNADGRGTGVRVTATPHGPLLFHSCELGAVVCEPDTQVALLLESCSLHRELELPGGRASLVNCRALGGEASLRFGPGCDRVLVSATEADLPSACLASEGVTVERAAPLPRIEVTDRVYPFPPARRPTSERLVSVRETGAVGDGEADDTAAFETALADLEETGGTVYVSAGHYRITRPLLVPAGVELRGVFEGPTHTMIPGSCLFAVCGRGEENGTPFLSLAPGSGVRGLVVWYPEQTYPDLTPYPWAVGAGCWIRDVALANPWQAVDFASAADTGDHLISGLTGAPLRRGLFVDNAGSPGFVENIQFVIHYWDRNDSGLPCEGVPKGAKREGIDFMDDNLEAFRFGTCADEFLMGNFVYATQTGLALESGFRGTVHLHGCDSAEIGVRIRGDVHAELVDTNVASWHGPRATSFLIETTPASRVRLLNTSCWGAGPALALRNQGPLDMRQVAIWAMYDSEINGSGPLSLSSVHALNPHDLRWFPEDDPHPSVAFHGVRLQQGDDLLPGPILSRNCVVRASSEHSRGEGARRAVDGSVTNKWTSVAAPEHWLELDLGRVCRVSGIEIMHEGHAHEEVYNTRDFALFGRAAEDEPWRELDRVTGNTASRTVHTVAAELRFVRLEITRPAQNEDTHARIPEISVFGEELQAE
jgi:hypothetical protein